MTNIYEELKLKRVESGLETLKVYKSELTNEEFKELKSRWQLDELKTIEPQKRFVSENMVSIIRLILDIDNLSNEELQTARNTIVKELTKDIDNFDMWTRMSMITAVIDNEKWNRNMAV